MPFVRILFMIIAALLVGVVGLAFFRPDPAAPPPQAETSAPPASRPVPVSAPRDPPQMMSPADASSPAEITAREAAEAQRRLEQEQQEQPMMTPDTAPVEMMPPDVSRPVK